MSLSGKIQTVLGPISQDQLGVTMAHEHLLIDGRPMHVEPSGAGDKAESRKPVSMDNQNWIRYHFGQHRENPLLGDVDTAIEEAKLYKQSGGNSLIDVTTYGLGPDPDGLRRIARATQLNIVAATGYYTQVSHPPDMDLRTTDELSERMTIDITIGINGTSVKAGVIGELGCSWPLHANESKVLQAAAKTQYLTGASISIHPGINEDAPSEIMDILVESKADPSRVIIGHIDRTVADRTKLKELADRGCFIEYDLFGQELSYFPGTPRFARPGDAHRLDQIEWLISEGYGKQVLISHDIGRKSFLVRYGGFGYGHILDVIVPWMRVRGINEEHIENILVGNPSQAFTIG